MSGDRLFTDEELKEMGQRTLDLLLSRIEAGDQRASAGLSKRMYGEFKAMHDLYRDWLTHLLTFIGRRYGDEVLHQALEETVGGFTQRLASAYRGKDTRQKLQVLAAGLRGHLNPFTIEEETEKFVLSSASCGSGGALIREGYYDPPCDFLRISDPQPMTFNRPNFPVYCAHCYFQNISPLEPGGEPVFVTEPALNLGYEPCRIFFFK